MSRLQHANIVSIFDIGLREQHRWLVLEYIDGESLRQMNPATTSLEVRLQIMRDIREGVAAAHAQDIVHCDIKPANILLNEQGQARVADFGLAWLADAGGDDSALYGTPQYMAPEYIETHQHRKVSDVFSLGLVCYELCTGKPAYTGNDVYQVLHAIANTPVAAPSRINPDIDDQLSLLKTLRNQAILAIKNLR